MSLRIEIHSHDKDMVELYTKTPSGKYVVWAVAHIDILYELNITREDVEENSYFELGVIK